MIQVKAARIIAHLSIGALIAALMLSCSESSAAANTSPYPLTEDQSSISR